MVLSLVVPGAGQIYRCRNVEGLVCFAVIVLGYFTNPAVGALAHVACIWHAGSASTATRSASGSGLIKPETRSL